MITKQVEDIRNKAMETWDETNKRRNSSSSDSSSDDVISSKRSRTPLVSETVVYLKTWAEQEFELRKEEMQLKKEELQIQREQQDQVSSQQNLIQQQLVQQNQLMMDIMKKSMNSAN